MIEIGQEIVCRRAARGYECRVVEFPSARLRDLLDEDEEERSAVLQCAITFFSGPHPNEEDVELVWYARTEVLTVRCCIRWPQPYSRPTQIPDLQVPNDRYLQVPEGACPEGEVMVCHERYVQEYISISGLAVFNRIRRGQSEEVALMEVMRANSPEFRDMTGQHLLMIGEYRRAESVYMVRYGFGSIGQPENDLPVPNDRFVHVDEGIQEHTVRMQLKQSTFAVEYLQEILFSRRIALALQTTAHYREAIEILLRQSDPDFVSIGDMRYEHDRTVYVVTYQAVLHESVFSESDRGRVDEMDEAREERARRYREARQEVRDELNGKLKALKEAVKPCETVQKEKQVEENPTGLRRKRPDIIGDDD